jgi:hypothetical protein
LVHVRIDTGSKRDAELIAAALPGQPSAAAIRGYGIIRLRFGRERDARQLVDLVAGAVERHGLGWARVRIGEAEHMFRGRRR